MALSTTKQTHPQLQHCIVNITWSSAKDTAPRGTDILWLADRL